MRKGGPVEKAASLLFQPPSGLLPVLAAALAVTAVLGALLSARPLLAAALALVAFLVVTLELILALEILIALIAAEMIGHKNVPPKLRAMLVRPPY
jgi:hypothetical protein